MSSTTVNGHDFRVSIGPPNRIGESPVKITVGDRLWEDQVNVVKRRQRAQMLADAADDLGCRGGPRHQELAGAIEDALGEVRLHGTTADYEADSQAEPIEFPAISYAELMSTAYDLEFLLQWFLVARQPCIFAGPKKGMKTTLLAALMLALSTGRDFLGKWQPTRAVRCGFMSGESGLAVLQETFRRIANAMGIDPSEVGSSIVVSDRLPQLHDETHIQALKEWLVASELEVLVVDPIYLAMSGADAGNLFIQGAMLRAVSEVCQEVGVTMILAHHTKKGVADPYKPAELEDIAWAGFQEFARQWILVSRREQYEPGSGRHKLWLSYGGSAGHSGLYALNISEGTADTPGGRTWRSELLTADEARAEVQDAREDAKTEKQEQKLEGIKKRLVSAAAKYKDGQTARTIRDTAGVSGALAALAFSELIEAGDLVPCDVFKGNRKTPYEGYRLSDDD